MNYDENEVLYVVLEEFAKIVQDMGQSLYPNLPPATQAEFQALNARLIKLGQVSSQLVPPQRLSALRSHLQNLLSA